MIRDWVLIKNLSKTLIPWPNYPELFLSPAEETQFWFFYSFFPLLSSHALILLSAHHLQLNFHTEVWYCLLTNVPGRPLYQGLKRHCPDYLDSRLWFLATNCHAAPASHPLPLARCLSNPAWNNQTSCSQLVKSASSFVTSMLLLSSLKAFLTKLTDLHSAVQVTKVAVSLCTSKSCSSSSFLYFQFRSSSYRKCNDILSSTRTQLPVWKLVYWRNSSQPSLRNLVYPKSFDPDFSPLVGKN